MVKWEEIGTAFTDETRPDFLPDNKDVKERAHLWAPEIRYVKGKYVLFYSLAQWGNHWVSTVGYAFSDSPEGPFTSRLSNTATLWLALNLQAMLILHQQL